jgi:hypothetical protein
MRICYTESMPRAWVALGVLVAGGVLMSVSPWCLCAPVCLCLCAGWCDVVYVHVRECACASRVCVSVCVCHLPNARAGPLVARDQPVYIVEIGAGHAKMAFLTLHMLVKMREFFPNARPFKYIITDFTQANVDFWDKHPPLQKYFDAGLLDMAKFGAWLALLLLLCKGSRGA